MPSFPSAPTQHHANPPSDGPRKSASLKKGEAGLNTLADTLRAMPVNADAERAALSCMLKAEI